MKKFDYPKNELLNEELYDLPNTLEELEASIAKLIKRRNSIKNSDKVSNLTGEINFCKEQLTDARSDGDYEKEVLKDWQQKVLENEKEKAVKDRDEELDIVEKELKQLYEKKAEIDRTST